MIPADGTMLAADLPARPRLTLPRGLPLARLAAVTLLTGVGAGIGGMSLGLLLHLIQHVAYGYSPAAVMSQESFLQGVTAATPSRRVAVLFGCGTVAGCGWWAVYRFGRPLVSIRRATDETALPMPILATTGHALLQIVTVALGSPLGREVAPREIGAMLAGWMSRTAGLTVAETSVMVACGAGAGLAAVYNVPLAGAMFVLEVLLKTVRLSAVIPAVAACWIATVVAWAGLGNETQYRMPAYSISLALVAWSVMAGPVLGFAAHYYIVLARYARARAPRNIRLLPWCIAVFTAIGVGATWFPLLLGNGKGPTQLGLGGDVPVELAAVLVILKLAATTGSLGAGAEGGLLTPGLTVGALLSIVLAHVCNHIVHVDIPPGACAIVGATAFLAVSMQMPITAIVLIFEFTHVGQDFLIPIMAAITGSTAMRAWLVGHRSAAFAPLPNAWSPIDPNLKVDA